MLEHIREGLGNQGYTAEANSVYYRPHRGKITILVKSKSVELDAVEQLAKQFLADNDLGSSYSFEVIRD